MTSYRWTPLEEKGPPAEGKRRSLWPSKLLVQHLGVAVVVSLLLVTVFAAAGMAPRPLWFVVAALAVGVVSLAIRLVVPETVETSWPGRHDDKLAALRARTNDNRTQFIATWLQESSRERRAGEGSQTFARRVRPLLFELATDRLVHRHGVDPEREPERARGITGDQLWQLIAGDDKRTASLDEIEYAIHTIENL
ncbi:hypothetical protein [Kribbella sp. VKM Ac-2566]|uniref:hypothetical protein n=1 Tax=Kribbella sp. VKM Ac-2566 TaxID=2512218 RepID=UPI0010DAC9B2|nr:hypothetical protein [Kribbella sp. VKM Ac-2566]TDW98910.1 hypothetical protein EV647_3642 [Kribbella sp. VKM Ac-2566]